MRRISVLLSAMLLVTLLAGACQPIVAPTAMEDGSDLRSVTGELFLAGVPEWGGIGIAFDLAVDEVDAATHEAVGHVNWRNFMPAMEEGMPDWKVVNAEARYVLFGEDFENGEPGSVIIIAQIVDKAGFGQGEPGEFAYLWFHESGADGGEPALWAMRYHSLDPFLEFFPADQPPAVEYTDLETMIAEDPALPIGTDVGELRIN
jgi:hypothetical protein